MMVVAVGVAERPTPHGAEQLWLDGIKVVVVEDDADAAEMVATVLRQHRAEVITTSTGEAALNILADYDPDVLVCDIGLPGIDGYALMQRVREMERARASVRAERRADGIRERRGAAASGVSRLPHPRQQAGRARSTCRGHRPGRRPPTLTPLARARPVDPRHPRPPSFYSWST